MIHFQTQFFFIYHTQNERKSQAVQVEHGIKILLVRDNSMNQVFIISSLLVGDNSMNQLFIISSIQNVIGTRTL